MTNVQEPMIKADHLPLLLHRHDVFAWLPGINLRALIEYKRDGDLRVFRPNPASRWGYYFAADVSRIAGRRLDTGWIEELPEELATDQFTQHSGLAPWALYLALRHGTLAHRRTACGVRVLTGELRKFV